MPSEYNGGRYMQFFLFLYGGLALLSVIQGYFTTDLPGEVVVVASALIAFCFGNILARQLHRLVKYGQGVFTLSILAIAIGNIAFASLGRYLEAETMLSFGTLVSASVGALVASVMGVYSYLTLTEGRQ